jgi:predicted nucleic acid-binding protein
MNVVDSSAWLEYLSGSSRAEFFVEAIEATRRLIVPVIVIYELFKKILCEPGEQFALEVYAVLSQGQVVDVDSALANSAARFNLPLADSLIYATAQRFSATLWTQGGQSPLPKCHLLSAIAPRGRYVSSD